MMHNTDTLACGNRLKAAIELGSAAIIHDDDCFDAALEEVGDEGGARLVGRDQYGYLTAVGFPAHNAEFTTYGPARNCSERGYAEATWAL